MPLKLRAFADFRDLADQGKGAGGVNGIESG